MTFGPLEETKNHDSPVLRRLNQTWDEYDYEEIDEDDVLDVLDRVEQLTLAQLESLEQAAKKPNVDILDPNRIAIVQAFEEHLRALDKMREFFFDGEPSLVDEAMESIQRATNQMMKGMEGILTENDLPPKLCISCQSPNPRGAKSCSSCFSALPFIERHLEKRLLAVAGPELEAKESARSTPNYIEMANAYDDWIFEELTDHQFLSVAKRIRKRYQDEYIRRSEALELAGGREPFLETLTELTADSLDVMDYLIGSFEKGDYQAVEQGMHRLDQATNSLVALEDEEAVSTSTSSPDENTRS